MRLVIGGAVSTAQKRAATSWTSNSEPVDNFKLIKLESIRHTFAAKYNNHRLGCTSFVLVQSGILMLFVVSYTMLLDEPLYVVTS